MDLPLDFEQGVTFLLFLILCSICFCMLWVCNTIKKN